MVNSTDKSLLDVCYAKKWVVYCKPPFGSSEQVVAYLGRYTHRVAISNNRILSLENGKVSFFWRDYVHGSKIKPMTLDAEEFICRFLLHVLPSGFRKIRHYGLFALRDKGRHLALCRKLTNTPQTRPTATAIERLQKILGSNFSICPCCGNGFLSRDPPAVAVSYV